MKLKNVFINELGNRVEVKTESATGTGSRPHTEEEVTYNALKYLLRRSANDTIEHTMSFKEAEELHKLLGYFLDKYGNRSKIQEVSE